MRSEVNLKLNVQRKMTVAREMVCAEAVQAAVAKMKLSRLYVHSDVDAARITNRLASEYACEPTTT